MMGGDNDSYVNAVTLRGRVGSFREIIGAKDDAGYSLNVVVKDYEFPVIYYGSRRGKLEVGDFIVIYGGLGFHRGQMCIKANRIILPSEGSGNVK